ncbi:hypothetical protein C8J56DRAFT_1173075 [Mycena floridula]|nr:hypothetical protein C8J56DRAFT_1173075 [Mycena floridula]
MSPPPPISKAAEEQTNVTNNTSPPPSPKLKDEVPKSTQTPTEYQAGRVICGTCGRGVSFRDELTGAFSVKHWDAHRLTCAAVGGPPLSSAVGQPSTVIFAEDVHSPHVKSCLAKKVTGRNVYGLEERNTLFPKDPDIRKFDAERVLCATCDKWIPINPDDHLSAVQIWLQHRSGCNKSSGPSALRILAFNPEKSSHSPGPNRPGSPSSGHSHHSPEFNGQQHQGHMLLPNPGSPQHQQQHQTLWSTNPTSTHESRRRNAEQRAATLRSGPLIRFVEPNRVFCSLCLKWHRGKCLKRSERRAAKNRERGGEKKDKGRPVFSGFPPYPPHPYHGRFSPSEDEASDEPSSAMPLSSALGYRPSGMRDQPHSRQEPPKKKIKLEDNPEELDAEGSEEPDADGEPDDDEIVEIEQTREPVVPRY